MPTEDNTLDILPVPIGYDTFLQDLKARIGAAQVRAALAVNRELVLLYWQIGHDILARQQDQGCERHRWGAGRKLHCCRRPLIGF